MNTQQSIVLDEDLSMRHGSMRKQVFLDIENNPGLTLPELADRHEIDAIRMSKVLWHLQNDGLVKRDDQFRFHSASTLRLPQATRNRRTREQYENDALAVLEIIEDDPGISKPEIAEQVNLTPNHLGRTLSYLIEQEMVQQINPGRKRHRFMVL